MATSRPEGVDTRIIENVCERSGPRSVREGGEEGGLLFKFSLYEFKVGGLFFFLVGGKGDECHLAVRYRDLIRKRGKGDRSDKKIRTT